MPEILGAVRGRGLLQLQARLPTRFCKVHGQGIYRDQHALGAALKITVKRQVVDLDRLALGIGTLELRGIQTDGGTLQGALAPGNPQLATGLDLGEIPILGQGFGQPFRPVALRQARIDFDLAVLPFAGTNAATQTHGHRLSIGQGQAGIEALAGGAGFQTQADVRQCQR
ncbi:hypothetical protein D3C84_859360 [compost metagenome]